MTAAFQNDYSNISFWERYVDSSLAEVVAKCFPKFWKEQNRWYHELYHHLNYTDEMATASAYPWAMNNATKLATLPWSVSKAHPFADIKRASEECYLRDVDRAASLYLESTSPIRPDWPLTPNLPRLSDGTFFLQGARLGDQATVQTLLKNIPHGDDYICWGPLWLNRQEAETSHFCVAGVTRSGKTTLLMLLAQSLAAPHQRRFILFDAKSSLLKYLTPAGTDPLGWYHVLNPFDRRSTAWDIAADANTHHRAAEIAAILLPTLPGDKPYFVDASRKLVVTAIEILNQVDGTDWTFLDLLLALRPTNIQQTLQQTPAGRSCLATYLPRRVESTYNLLSTLDSRIDPYLPIAAAWNKSEKKISLREWAEYDSTGLVLGTSHTHQWAMARVNRVLVRLLSDALLDSHIHKPWRTFVFLDELESLGQIESLPDLLNMGAEVGVTMVLGFHDLDTLRSIYGEQTEGLLAMCSHMAVLRINSRSTAAWAADLFGPQEVALLERSQSARIRHYNDDETDKTAPHDASIALGQSLRTMSRHAVSVSQFMDLPLTSKQVGLTGYFKSHLHPAYRGHIEGSQLFPPPPSEHQEMKENWLFDGSHHKHLLWNPNAASGFLPRPDSDFEVPTNAVPSYAEDEVFSPTHPAGPFDREVDEDEVIEPDQSKEISSDGDEDDFEMRPIRLPPIKRNNQADR